MKKIYPTPSKVKQARESKNYTQELLAEHAGVSVRTIQNIESGNGCLLETLKNVAAVLELSFTRFLPKPNESAYKGSWLKLIQFTLVTSLIKPIFYSLLFVLTLTGTGTLVMLADAAKIVNLKTLSEEQLTSQQERIKKGLNEMVSRGDLIELPSEKALKQKNDFFSSFLNRKPENNTAITSIKYMFRLMVFFWYLAIIYSAYVVARDSRDFNVLVSKPIARWFSSYKWLNWVH